MIAMSLHTETDPQIIAHYLNGERDAAASAFVRRHQRFVLSVAMRYLNDTEDARDAAQETFIRAFKGFSNFRGDSSVPTWLYRITKNVCINKIRKDKFLSFLSFGDAEGERGSDHSHEISPEQRTLNTDFEQFFSGVLKTLPEKQRETFCLRYYDELSYEEISAMVGTSVGALKANYHWAVKKIAAALNESEYHGRQQ